MYVYVWREIFLQSRTVLCQYLSKSDILYKSHLIFFHAYISVSSGFVFFFNTKLHALLVLFCLIRNNELFAFSQLGLSNFREGSSFFANPGGVRGFPK